MVQTMKKITLLILILPFFLIVGCVNTVSNQYLKTNEAANLQNNGYSIAASIDHITVDPSRPNNHMLNIFMTVKNTGNKAISPFWFSKVTDYAGVTNNGLGSTSGLLYPGESATGTDYIIIYSDKEYDALLKGATLNVRFSQKNSLTEPILNIGDASWNIDLKNI